VCFAGCLCVCDGVWGSGLVFGGLSVGGVGGGFLVVVVRLLSGVVGCLFFWIGLCFWSVRLGLGVWGFWLWGLGWVVFGWCGVEGLGGWYFGLCLCLVVVFLLFCGGWELLSGVLCGVCWGVWLWWGYSLICGGCGGWWLFGCVFLGCAVLSVVWGFVSGWGFLGGVVLVVVVFVGRVDGWALLSWGLFLWAVCGFFVVCVCGCVFGVVAVCGFVVLWLGGVFLWGCFWCFGVCWCCFGGRSVFG